MAEPFNRSTRPVVQTDRVGVRPLTSTADAKLPNSPRPDWSTNVFTEEQARVRNQTNLSGSTTASTDRYNRSTSIYTEVDGISNASKTNYNENLTVDKLLNRETTGSRRAPFAFTDFTFEDIFEAQSRRSGDPARALGSPITVATAGTDPAIGDVDDVLLRSINTEIPQIGYDFSNYDYVPSFMRSDGITSTAQNIGNSSSKLPNPLRDHNHFNYVVTLGILSPEQYNNPDSYRGLGNFDNYIVKSGGGFYDKRYQVADEVVNGFSEHAEYYIDDLEIDAVIAPNANTGVALGTTINFNIIEPFSMGNFIQAIIGSSAELGWGAYTDAPFCLKIDFVGWDEEGSQSVSFVGKPIYIPILITKVDFGVSGKGSAYQVQAVAYSEAGLRDEVNRVKTPINASGRTVHEVLTTNRHSVTTVLNERTQELEKAGALAKGDRYIICFPQDPGDISRVVEENTRQVTDAASISVSTNISLYEKLLAFASDESKMNDIGRSVLIDDVSEGSDQQHPKSSEIYDSVNDVWWRPGPDEYVRNFQTNQNETITHIIDKVVLESNYAEKNAIEKRNDGIKEWFRVNTQVFIDPNTQSLQQAGRQPKIFVYAVVQYFPDEARTNAPSERPMNTEGLKKVALKTYDYIYTGRNEDVLSFDINFNNAFFQTAFANYGMNTGASASGAANKATLQNGDDIEGAKIVDPSGALALQREVTGSVETSTDLVASRHGLRSGDVKKQIAEMFHDRIINMPVDMISAEMTIFGDPFFLPQQTGNFIGDVDRGNYNVLSDGTMSYLQNEIYTVVNFRTPFDYQVSGASMEFPAVVQEFSGLFSVWAVTNTFSRGQFTQVLKMIRRRGQTDDATSGQGVFISPTGEVILSDFAKLQKSVNNLFGIDEILKGKPEKTTTASGYAQNNAPQDTFGELNSPITEIGPLIFDPRQYVFESEPKASLPPTIAAPPTLPTKADTNEPLKLEEWNYRSRIDQEGGIEGYRQSLGRRANDN